MKIKLEKLLAASRDIWRLIVRPTAHERAHSMKSRYGRAAAVSAAGLVLGRLIAMGVGLALARQLGAGDYGLFGFVQSTLNIMTTLFAFGMGMTTTRNIAFYRDTDPGRCARIVALGEVILLGLGILGALLAFFFAGSLVQQTSGHSDLAALVRLAAPMILFELITGLQSGVLIGMERLRDTNLLSVMSGVLNGAGGIAGAAVGGVQGAIVGWTAGCGATAVISWLVTRRVLKRAGLAPRAGEYRACFSEHEMIAQYSLPATLQSLIATGGIWISQTMVLRTGDGGSSQLGAFTVANQWRWAALYLPTILASLSLPFLANLHGSGQSHRLLKAMKYQMLFNGVFALMATAGIVLLAPWIVMLYGEGYSDSLLCMRILALSLVFSSLNTVMKQRYVGLGYMWLYTAILTAHASALVAGTVLFIRGGLPPSVSFSAAIAAAELFLAVCLWINGSRILVSAPAEPTGADAGAIPDSVSK